MGQILASLKHDLKEARRYLRASLDGKDPDPMVPWDGKGPHLPNVKHETFEAHADEVIELFDRLVAKHAPTPPPASLSRLISQLRGRNTPRVESGGYVESWDGQEWRIVGRLGDAPPAQIHGAPSAPAPVLALAPGCKRCGEQLGSRHGPTRYQHGDGETCGPCLRELERKAAAA